MKNNYPTENKKTNNLLKGFTVKQIVWFIIGALIALNALIFLILGLINDYASLPYSPFKVPNDGMIKALGGIDFKWFGVITLILGTFIFTLSLSMASKAEDRKKEREARREQRIKAMEEQSKSVVLNFEGTSSSIEK